MEKVVNFPSGIDYLLAMVFSLPFLLNVIHFVPLFLRGIFLYLCFSCWFISGGKDMRQEWLFRLDNYLKYKRRARRGVMFHSPFIYEFSNMIFESHWPESSWEVFEGHYSKTTGKKLDRISKKNGRLLSRVAFCFDMKNVLVAGQEEGGKIKPLYRYFMSYYSEGSKMAEQFSDYDMMIVSTEGATEMQLSQYFETAVKYATNNSVFVMEEIYRSPVALKVWEKIKANTDVTVTIDLYRVGLVFFRKESSKENFVIKY